MSKTKVVTDGNGARLVFATSVPKGSVVLSYLESQGEIQEKPCTYSIQIGKDKHILFAKTIRYMNHSFQPTVQLEILNGSVVVRTVRDCLEGEDITFDYSTTEVNMASPFNDMTTGLAVNGSHREDGLNWVTPDVTVKNYTDYRSKGLTLIPNAVPKWLCEKLQLIALNNKGTSVDHKAPYEDNDGAPYPPELMDEGGHYKYNYLSGKQLDVLYPEIELAYHHALLLARKVTREDAIPSPYQQSKYLLIHYTEGGRQGHHRDTQPITVLLYVTDCEDGETVANLFDGTEVRIKPRAGTILIMQGRHVRHESAECKSGNKIVVPFNVYTTTDTWRPDSLDSDTYWSK